MQFVSTRDAAERVSLSQALLGGLAPDGGLYVPEALPTIEPDQFEGLSNIQFIAQALLTPFFEGDRLAGQLGAICDETFTFPIPLRELDRTTSILELFHGPTAAFKDVGARFLASCMSRLNDAGVPGGGDEPITILVATSGDTGGAVASAFFGKPNVEVIVLYPKGRVSPRQEKQLTCWGGNVRTFAVRGDFDACQHMVKAAFSDRWWRDQRRLSSANSINIGRLLPQMTYYAAASVWYRKRHGHEPSFIVPSGNLGNVLACIYAREAGLPIDQIVLATNANRTVVDFLETGEWNPGQTVSTLANAMDVSNPSNMERLRHLWPDAETIRAKISVEAVDDAAIADQIAHGPDRWAEVFDPHTACAIDVRSRRSPDEHCVVVSTAHPAKFDTVVEPLLGRQVAVPQPLAALLARPSHVTEIDADLAALREAVARGAEALMPPDG